MKFGLTEDVRSYIKSEYINRELTHLFKHFETKIKTKTMQASWINGLVKGTNQVIEQHIRPLADAKYNKFSRKAKFYAHAYNSHYKTRLGMSPYKIIFNQKSQIRPKLKNCLQLMKAATVHHRTIV